MKKRRYTLRKRAGKQAETRQRIVEATVELHSTIGPAQTSISAIADEARVQRLTVYRHFPDRRSLFKACTGHFFAGHPMPDPEVLKRTADPEERMKSGLTRAYRYFEKHQTLFTLSYRDATKVPELFEVSPFLAHWTRLRDVLVEAWDRGAASDSEMAVVVAHALDFTTWDSLVRRRGLGIDRAVEMMVRLTRCLLTGGRGNEAESGGGDSPPK